MRYIPWQSHHWRPKDHQHVPLRKRPVSAVRRPKQLPGECGMEIAILLAFGEPPTTQQPRVKKASGFLFGLDDGVFVVVFLLEFVFHQIPVLEVSTLKV